MIQPANAVLLVGNGPSALAHRFGRLVDTFGTVVRINDFVTESFEEHVGRRFDIWAVTPRRDRPYRNCRELLAISAAPRHCRIVRRAVRRLYQGQVCTFIDNRRCRSLIAPWWHDREYEKCWPSTGLVTLLFLLTRHEFVVHYGFDHLYHGEQGTPRYFGVLGIPATVAHDPDKERAVFGSLEEGGRVGSLVRLVDEKEIEC